MKKKRLLAGALCGVLMLSGCGAEEPAPEENAGEKEQVQEEEVNYVEVVDQNDMVAKVPKDLERVALTALPLPSIYAITGAPIETLVGMHPGSTSAIENSVMAAMYPELLDVPSNFIDGVDINIEELLKLDPQVVMYWAEYMNQYDLLTAANIPAVGVKTQAGGDALATMASWLDIMGQMLGTSGETQKVLDYGKQVQDEVAAEVAKIPDEEKPKVLYLYNHSSEDISVSGNGFYGGFWIEAAGGINVARDIQGHSSVNMEQIYEWDPDIVLITTFTETMPEDLYNNTIEGQDWSKVSAVKNGKVIKEPLGTYRWFPPSGDAPLMSKWMAQTLHPDIFTYNMVDEIIEFYKEFYHYDLTQEQAEGILQANPEAAKGASFGGSH